MILESSQNFYKQESCYSQQQGNEQEIITPPFHSPNKPRIPPEFQHQQENSEPFHQPKYNLHQEDHRELDQRKQVKPECINSTTPTFRPPGFRTGLLAFAHRAKPPSPENYSDHQKNLPTTITRTHAPKPVTQETQTVKETIATESSNYLCDVSKEVDPFVFKVLIVL